MFHMPTWARLLAGGLLLSDWAHAQDSHRVASEDDYFANVPVVLTASRLDQPLNEAPGAITVIDRNTIRLSGARTLVDVLRLVPGYLTGGLNGANPNAAYHIPIDDEGTRNLVLIDGRSVYSSVYKGDTHRGMMDVMLEDIERIEVLRGANSAAYGANAMFGVINIITRHSADTIGGEVSLTKGNNQIWDRRARIGVGDDKASLRLSMGEQRDGGYLDAHDDRRLSQVNLRTDFKPTAVDDVMIRAGLSRLGAQGGYAGNDDDPPRTVFSRDVHFNGVWKHQLSATDELQCSASYMEDWVRDAVPYPPLPSVLLDFSGTGRRTNLEVQRKTTLSPTVRLVAGAGYKDERAYSPPLYSRTDWLSYNESRAFGTVEWRATPEWLLNAGAFVGHHSVAGQYTAPRLMVNWLPSPEHTFRAGVTESVRTPTLAEYYGDIRYYIGSVLAAQTVAASGHVKPERLRSQELGYLGRFPAQSLTLDVRAYRERMDSVIHNISANRATPLPVSGYDIIDFVNLPGLEIRGAEGQLRWKPQELIELWVNHSVEHVDWDLPRFDAQDERRPPRQATTLGLFMHLPNQVTFTVIAQRLGEMTWRDNRDMLPVTRRTDVRVGMPVRVGDVRAELSYTVQSLEGAHPVFLVREPMQLGLRSFVQLKMEL